MIIRCLIIAVLSFTSVLYTSPVKAECFTNHIDLGGGTNSISGNCTIENKTANYGGAVKIDGGTLTISAGTIKFVNNKSNGGSNSGTGGAIYNGDSSDHNRQGTVNITVDNNGLVEFTGNNGGNYGGAIFNTNGLVNIIVKDGKVVFSGNKASKGGGAIYNYNKGVINLYAKGGDLSNPAISFVGDNNDNAIDSINNITTLNIGGIIDGVEYDGVISLPYITGDNNGNGSININSGIVLANKEISQKSLNISKGFLKIDASNLKIVDTITNNGTIELGKGTLDSAISGTGKVVITDNVGLNKKIETIDLEIKEGKELKVLTNVDFNIDDLTNSGTLNLSNNNANDVVNVNNLISNDNSKIKLDVDFSSGTIKSDIINISSNIEGKFDLDINAIGSIKTASVELFKGTDLSNLKINEVVLYDSEKDIYQKFSQDAINKGIINIYVGDTPWTLQQIIAADTFKYGDEKKVVNEYSLDKDLILNSDLGTLTRYKADEAREFTINGNGKSIDGNGNKGVTVNNSDILNLNDVKFSNFDGSTIINNGTVNYKNTQVVFDNFTYLGDITGEGSLTLDFAGGKIDYKNKITQKNLSVANIYLAIDYSNLNVSNKITNEGTLEVQNITGDFSTEIGNVIEGHGTTILKAKADVVLKNDITQEKLDLSNSDSGDYSFTVEGNIDASVVNNSKMIINEGGYIKGSVEGSGKTVLNRDLEIEDSSSIQQTDLTINSGKTLTAKAGKLIITDAIDNQGTLVLGDGILSSSINGEGNTVIDGLVDASTALISQKDLTINENKSLTIKANNLSINNAISNLGTLNLNNVSGTFDTAIIGTGTTSLNADGNTTIETDITQSKLLLSNNNFEIVDGKTITADIRNIGILTVSGNVIGNIYDDQTTKTGKTIINKDLSLGDYKIDQANLTINSGKTLTAKADKIIISNAIENQGTLNLNNVSGTFDKAIIGTGTTSLNADNDTIINADITQSKLLLLDNNFEIANGKTISANINNIGTLKVSGNVVGDIYDDQTTKTGKTIINKDLSLGDYKIDQANLTINSGKTLTAKADKLIITNTINNQGTLNLGDGTLSSSIDGSGKTIIDGTIDASSALITQNDLTINADKSLTINANSLNVLNAIENQGNLILNNASGTFTKAIIGTGTTNLNAVGYTTINADITQSNLLLSNNNFEIVDGKTITADIRNIGILTVSGNVIGNIYDDQTTKTGKTIINKDLSLGDYKIDQANLTINSGKTLTAKAD
ncbi:MAG: hypothetical protein MJ247_02705, partial [Alphaproteobacteria bacterium]|nr:hypothetical protein [Alphaproteobacteria bacterium]